VYHTNYLDTHLDQTICDQNLRKFKSNSRTERLAFSGPSRARVGPRKQFSWGGPYHNLTLTETCCHFSLVGGCGTGDWRLHHAWQTYRCLYCYCSTRLQL